MSIRIKRAYEDASSEEGVRVLVDRLWPRGVSKETLKIDYWMKEIAPSNDLRKWFNHDPDKFEEFTKKYKQELQVEPEKIEQFERLQAMIRTGRKVVTLVYGAKDEQHNQAVVLQEWLTERL